MQTLERLQNGELKGALSLKLSEQLTYFPEEIFELADTLEMLDLSGNRLTELPVDFGRLQKLKIFFCSDNLFTVLPEVLADCPLLDIVGFKANVIETVPARALNPNLRWLILTNNKIAHLPAQIGECYRLQKLMLAGNRLTDLPAELSQCRSLSLLRISANRLSQLPQWLLAMPKLSWLAFSGNLFSKVPGLPQLSQIGWDELQINNLLGQGASGIIYKASRHLNGESQQVAVKVFKGDVTSDGLPGDELNAYIAAGSHPGLVPLVAQIAGHPEGKQALVMELIPEGFFNLGLTPSLDSCTRDIFRADLSITPDQALNIARTIASLAAQLHSKGIMHADLYAHNTLIDDTGNTLFGDFGAACFYDIANEPLAAALQRLEVRAYGYLLDDLLSLSIHANAHDILTTLQRLRDQCLAPDVLTRPDFQYINKELGKRSNI